MVRMPDTVMLQASVLPLEDILASPDSAGVQSHFTAMLQPHVALIIASSILAGKLS